MTGDELPQLEHGAHRLRCPECGRGDRDRTMGVTVYHDRTVWHCFRCGQADAERHGRTPSTRSPSRTPAQASSHPNLVLAAHWRQFWSGLVPIRGTVAERYLLARGCALPPLDGDLRFAPALRHRSGYTGPAIVALVTDALTGELMTLHRTWIKADGQKADVDPPRMLLGKHQKKGGVIRLWPNEAVTPSLAIAEGIETALTAADSSTPVWSVIDAGNLRDFPVLEGIESLLIIADHDEAGIGAARKCALRWHQAGREVRIAMSPHEGEDLNDYARRFA